MNESNPTQEQMPDPYDKSEDLTDSQCREAWQAYDESLTQEQMEAAVRHHFPKAKWYETHVGGSQGTICSTVPGTFRLNAIGEPADTELEAWRNAYESLPKPIAPQDENVCYCENFANPNCKVCFPSQPIAPSIAPQQNQFCAICDSSTGLSGGDTLYWKLPYGNWDRAVGLPNCVGPLCKSCYAKKLSMQPEQPIPAAQVGDTHIKSSLIYLAGHTEGEARAHVEVISCRLGLGHAIDISAQVEDGKQNELPPLDFTDVDKRIGGENYMLDGYRDEEKIWIELVCRERQLLAAQSEIAALKAKLGDGWIDCKQELPPKSYGHNYLVWCICDNKAGGYTDLAAYGDYICEMEDAEENDPRYLRDNDDGNWQDSGWHREETAHGGSYDTVFVDLDDKVTHWMHKPASPALKQEDGAVPSAPAEEK